jgi:O-succinylhomoserine sulfhydrylase
MLVLRKLIKVKAGIEARRQFFDKIKLFSLSANLGNTRTIVTHSAFTAHNKLSVEGRLAVCITVGLVRLSVGLETLQDVMDD